MTKNPSDNQLYIGVALKYLRAKKGYAQNTLAEITGMSVTTVNYIERAKSKAKLDSLEILAEALDTTVMDMMNLGKELKMAEETSLRSIFGTNIYKIRTSKGLTQEQLASAAKVSVSHIRNIEKAKISISIDKIAALSNALKISPAILVVVDSPEKEQ